MYDIIFSEKETLTKTDRKKFINGAAFMGEIFFRVKSEQGSPFKVYF